jgi:hypothetical protein
MEVSGQLHPRYPLNRRLGEPQSRYGSYEKEKNIVPAGNRTPTIQPVARRYPTELSRKFTENTEW